LLRTPTFSAATAFTTGGLLSSVSSRSMIKLYRSNQLLIRPAASLSSASPCHSTTAWAGGCAIVDTDAYSSSTGICASSLCGILSPMTAAL
jgi:hypothetical protein